MPVDMNKLVSLDRLKEMKTAENAMMAAEYSTSKTYSVGDYAYHAGTLYKCTTAITTAEAWTSGHWTAVALGDDVSELKSALNEQIIISETQPVSENNKIWIDSDANSVQVPTMTDFNLIKNATLIRKSASGGYASFDDGAEGLPLRSLSVGESATSLVRCGRNLFDKNHVSVINCYISGSSEKLVSNTSHRTVYIPCKPNTKYTAQKIAKIIGDRFQIGYCNELPADNVAVYDINGKTASFVVGEKYSYTTTTGADAKYVVLHIAMVSEYEASLLTTQIELGETASEYSNYQGKTYTLSNGEPNEPVTTFLGDNTIFADVGNISIGYYADTTLVIESLQ